jgi:hypothetical protein
VEAVVFNQCYYLWLRNSISTGGHQLSRKMRDRTGDAGKPIPVASRARLVSHTMRWPVEHDHSPKHSVGASSAKLLYVLGYRGTLRTIPAGLGVPMPRCDVLYRENCPEIPVKKDDIRLCELAVIGVRDEFRGRPAALKREKGLRGKPPLEEIRKSNESLDYSLTIGGPKMRGNRFTQVVRGHATFPLSWVNVSLGAARASARSGAYKVSLPIARLCGDKFVEYPPQLTIYIFGLRETPNVQSYSSLEHG